MIVWLASYPRSGNTFLRVILNNIFDVKTYSIYNDVNDIAADDKTSDVVGHQSLPDGFDLSEARCEEKLYCIKTHELPDDRIDQSDKVLYLIRDGRESIVSYQKYIKNFGSVKRTTEDIIFGNVYSGGWAGHVKAWQPAKRKNTLLIKFEHLIDDSKYYIDKIAEFIDIQPDEKDVPSFEELNAINPKFFNTGKKDSWQTAYTDDDHLAFWLKSYTQMIEYGYSSYIPDVIKDQSFFLLFKQLSAENTYHLKEIMSIQNNQVKDTSKVMEILDQRLNQQMTLVSKLNKQLQEKDQMINVLNNKINVLNNKIGNKEQTIKHLTDSLQSIRSSISYKIAVIPKRLINKIGKRTV